MKKFLAISAHPDDVDFYCGGTLATLAEQGNRVEELIISNGSKGTHVVGFSGKSLGQIREKEQRAAAKILGIQEVHFLKEIDGEIENTKDLRRKLVAFIREIQPDIVMSFDPASLGEFEHFELSHRDHRQAGEAVFDALYPAVGNSAFFPELQKQGLGAHTIQEIWFFAASRPNKFVDISETLNLKKEALLCHKSQIRNTSNVKTLIRDNARTMGKKKGMKYAESFRTIAID